MNLPVLNVIPLASGAPTAHFETGPRSTMVASMQRVLCPLSCLELSYFGLRCLASAARLYALGRNDPVMAFYGRDGVAPAKAGDDLGLSVWPI